MIIRSLYAVPEKKLDLQGAQGVSRRVPIGRQEQVPNFSFRVFTLEALGHTPYHAHESEHVNYIIRGKGALKDEHGNLHPVQEGDFCLIYPNEKHQFRNLSDSEAFVFICAVMKAYE
ncbi:MAG: cupin domain-containing protein [Candidatus Marinimicrobia bacterium]|jgi:quercetin dioxygenase-like cupin family protein|nr:cupin domain-containing protein [Candidatus Neomarinimicrobiota bacterium]MDD4961497.1 cupin domain-containing protein [Candidatus Neomarinimicrobiota bacterium]MDD5708936.1 cupin domain-containing protein [Candidatus Neomarinimicrobiota bacterium]MDX9777491.1 cupin domain-containing protein [bacterium]